MQIIQLGSFPIEQVRNLETLEHKLGDWFAARDYPVRHLAYSQRFTMRLAITRLSRAARDLELVQRLADPLISQVDRLLAGDANAQPARVVRDLDVAESALLLDLFADAPALQQALTAVDTPLNAWAAVADGLSGLLWRLSWMKEQLRFYGALARQHLRCSTYLMLTWEGSDAGAGAIAATLQHTFGRPARTLELLPALLQGPYREHLTYLAPETSGQPYLAVLLAHDMCGQWDATTLHPLLSVNFDLALAIDIQTQGRNQAMRTAELAYNTARMLVRDTQLIDVRAQRIQADAERVMHELTRQSLHLVQLGVLVSGATLEELDAHVAEVQGRLGSQLRLFRPAGVQGEALKLWSASPAAAIDLPWRRRAMLSHGVGCLAGINGFHRAGESDGFFWGMDAVRRAPLFVDIFRENQAGHTLILGKSGSGKTFLLNVLALRGAAIAGYRVIGIDAFKNGVRVERAAGAGARCYFLGLETPINLLDIVYTEQIEGGWLPNQIQHVIGQLALLLGTPGRSADGKERLAPREFSIAERGLLDRALMKVYHACHPDMALAAMPRLSDLIAMLEQLREHEAHTLARELRLLLFGSDDPAETIATTLGRCFNETTAVDWNVGSDITYYDFSSVPEILRPFFYAQAIGAVLRFMTDASRDLQRKTMLQIDEFGYLMQIEALANLAATVCKVARKFGVALVVVDQNPDTFFGSEAGRRIAENCNQKVLFHLDDLPARRMGEAIADLTPEHIEFVSHAGVGQALAVLGNDVYVLLVEPSPREAHVLRGS